MITLAETKEYLRVDDSYQDEMIQRLIDTAEQFVRDYTDQDFADGAPEPVKTAATLYVSALFDGELDPAMTHIRLLLNPHRLLGLA